MAIPMADETTLDPRVVERAARWMARLWADDASAADEAACRRWRAEHPQHELAWRRLSAFEECLCAVPPALASQALREPMPPRRRAVRVLALALATGGLAYAARDTVAWRIVSAGHRTGTGEIRHILLADGTQVTLASGTAVDVRFDATQRLLVLHAGEVSITTAPDPSPAHRPFRVACRDGATQALGTRFTVRQDDLDTRLAVFEGAVALRPARDPQRILRVEAGQGVRFTADGAQAPVPVDESSAAWTRGVLVAEDMRLDTLVAELARYRSGMLRCDPRIAHLKVSGVFPLRDTDRALDNLALGLPVMVARRTRWWVTLQPAA